MSKVPTKAMSVMELAESNNKRKAELLGRLFVSVEEAAKRSKISTDMVYYLLYKGRVSGAYRVAGTWIIPERWRYYKRRRKKIEVSPLALQDPSKKVPSKPSSS